MENYRSCVLCYPVSSQNYMTSDGYNNDYDEDLSFSCGSYRALNSIESRYDDIKKDRQYKLGCHQFQMDDNYPWICFLSPETEYDKPFIYTCGKNRVMGGIYSKHSNSEEDRIWKFQCCFPYGSSNVTKSCQATDYINNFTEYFSFSLDDEVFTGAHSYHDNSSE